MRIRTRNGISLRVAVRLLLLACIAVIVWSALRTHSRNDIQQDRIDAAYAFAAAHPAVLEYIPCGCGCGYRLMHTSVERCFIASRSGPHGRTVRHDDHGATCWECVDIVHEVRALQEQGHSLAEIRRRIERTFMPQDRDRWTRTPEVRTLNDGVGRLAAY